MTGTHDTEPMRVWWEHAPAEERAAALQVPGLDVSGAARNSPFSAALRDAFLRVLFHAGSDLLMLPIQDVFVWSDRINVPATVGTDNWKYPPALAGRSAQRDPRGVRGRGAPASLGGGIGAGHRHETVTGSAWERRAVTARSARRRGHEPSAQTPHLR